MFGRRDALISGLFSYTVVAILALASMGIAAIIVLFFFGPLLQALSLAIGEKLFPNPRRCGVCKESLDPALIKHQQDGDVSFPEGKKVAGFGPWYAERFGAMSMPAQVALWFFYGFIWIPGWYWWSNRNRASE